MQKTFTGFGFGPIQGALFLLEAYRSGNFSRYVVAEVDRNLVEAVRANGGCYAVNIAHQTGIESVRLEGVELCHPEEAAERETLLSAIAESDEISTALPSVRFYDVGNETSVARLVAAGIEQRNSTQPTIVYASENHNHAAELLEESLRRYLPERHIANVQTLNTVIGKMSGVITDEATIERMGLETITPEIRRAILVEEFNRIFISRIELPDYRRGIDVFVEKRELLPFEEAKLYGHNAIHALMAYLADLRGLAVMSEVIKHDDIMEIARRAFIDESGETLIVRHRELGDELFTPEGYRGYAEDLLQRMVNPYLNDLVERVGRDHVRKLGYEDRIYGTMHLALRHGVEPVNMALGAAAGIVCLIRRADEQGALSGITLPAGEAVLTRESLAELLLCIWKEKADVEAEKLIDLTWQGFQRLERDGWL